MNSLAQGGLPVDVAETIAWYRQPGLGRPQRDRSAGVRSEPGGGVMATRELSNSPSMLPLFARAGAAAIPGASKLPFVGGGGRDVPDLTLRLSDVAVEPDRLERLRPGVRVRPARRGPRDLSAHPGLSAPAVADDRPELPVPGDRTRAHRQPDHPAPSDQEPPSGWTSSVRATPVEAHPRGKQFSLITEVRVGDELVWEEVSTNLKRGAGSDDGASAPGSASFLGPRTCRRPAPGRLAGDLGRRYGSVSGDLNPIHMHPLTARLFGFQSAIAHGMWTKARCLAALAGPSSRRVHGRGRVQEADLPARQGRVLRGGRGRSGVRYQVRRARSAQGQLAPGRPGVRGLVRHADLCVCVQPWPWPWP